MFPRRLGTPPSGLVQCAVKEAGASAGQAGSIDLGGKRTFTVAGALVLEAVFGPRFAATVAGAVCLELLTKKRLDGKVSDVTNQAKTTRPGDNTTISIRNFPKSPVLAGQSELVNKGAVATVAETAAAALAGHEAARRVNLEMVAAGGP